MLVRFEPRKGEYQQYVVGESSQFWDMIVDRCGPDVKDYLQEVIDDLSMQLEESPSADELEDTQCDLADHIAVEEMLYEYLDGEPKPDLKWVRSWLRYMHINVMPRNYGFNRHDDRTAQAHIDYMDKQRIEYDKGWN